MSKMNMMRRAVGAFMPAACACAMLALVVGGVAAQQPQGMRVGGTVESFDGDVLSIKSDKLGVVKVNLTADATVFGVAKGSLADVKPGAFIGVGAMPQADGSQRAIQVTIFTESQRGTGEGFRPWDRQPNSTMTNATVAETVGSVDGQVVVVKYKGGEKKVVIPPDAVILSYAVGDRAELKPGAHVLMVRALKKPDGSLEANRINVGRGGVVPQ